MLCGVPTVPYSRAGHLRTWGLRRSGHNCQARKTIRIYGGFLAISMGCMVVGMALPAAGYDGVRSGLWTAALVAELLMYPAVQHWVDSRQALPVDAEHNVERNKMWFIIVVGESIMVIRHGAAMPALTFWTSELRSVSACCATVHPGGTALPRGVGIDMHHHHISLTTHPHTHTSTHTHTRIPVAAPPGTRYHSVSPPGFYREPL